MPCRTGCAARATCLADTAESGPGPGRGRELARSRRQQRPDQPCGRGGGPPASVPSSGEPGTRRPCRPAPKDPPLLARRSAQHVHTPTDKTACLMHRRPLTPMTPARAAQGGPHIPSRTVGSTAPPRSRERSRRQPTGALRPRAVQRADEVIQRLRDVGLRVTGPAWRWDGARLGRTSRRGGHHHHRPERLGTLTFQAVYEMLRHFQETGLVSKFDRPGLPASSWSPGRRTSIRCGPVRPGGQR